MSGFLYALHVKCGGGCLRDVMGPARRSDEPEFAPEVVEAFYADLRKIGWTQVGENPWVWSCNRPCSGPPWSAENIRKTFRMRQGLKTKYTIKTINPDFYGTMDVTNP